MDQSGPQVTDQDIERIIAENEAGVADATLAYERAAKPYFEAVTPATSTVVYTTATSSAPAS